VFYTLVQEARNVATMYKTVRHGENSLQYTILPQQDDAGAITSANSSMCGRTSAGVRRRARRGRTATILIMTLILACGVVGAAVVVPLLISTDLVALPSAFQRFSSNNNGHHHGGHHAHHSTALQKNKTTTARQNTITLSSVSLELATSEDMATSSDTSTSVSAPSLSARANEEATATTKTSVQVTQPLSTEEAGTRATTQQQEPMEVGGLLEEDGGAKEHDHVGGSKKKALDEDMRNNASRMFVPADRGKENRSASVLEETTDQSVVVVPVRSTERPKHRSWLEPRWPFADPSSYFQWTVSPFGLSVHHMLK